ncbi:MAG: NAD(P)H-binding protein [Chloroflexi bacterium]|nr:NAD(P)H-binding protein [Chloroflexota bacterium]
MILVIGGTGFVGRALVRQLVEAGHEVRTLIRPSPNSPRLPQGVPVEVAVVSLNDLRGLRAALRGIDHIYHLAGGESSAQLFETDIEGTKTLIQAAAGSNVRQIIYLSHLDADKSSAFPALRAKGLAEEHIRNGNIPYTIIRSSVIFGPEDNFTTIISRLAQISPGVIFLPNKGATYLQPIWVEDLVTCLLWSLDNPELENKTRKIGGSEYLSLRQIFEIILAVTNRRRLILSAPTPFLRLGNLILQATFPKFPISGFFLDYLATDRTCETDSLPRIFGLMPARFTYRLNYLQKESFFAKLRARLSRK